MLTLVCALALLTITAALATAPAETSWANPVNRNLYRLAVCETGGINGGRPLWTHHNSLYVGALGFARSTWEQYRHRVKPLPAAAPERGDFLATPGQQYAVGRELVKEFNGFSSWPSCSIRLGLR